MKRIILFIICITICSVSMMTVMAEEEQPPSTGVKAAVARKAAKVRREIGGMSTSFPKAEQSVSFSELMAPNVITGLLLCKSFGKHPQPASLILGRSSPHSRVYPSPVAQPTLSRKAPLRRENEKGPSEDGPFQARHWLSAGTYSTILPSSMVA